MSGIAGIWNLDGRPADGAVLSRMSTTLRHRGADGEGRRIHGSTALACQHLWVTPEDVGEVQPLVANGVVLVMDGRLDNRDELIPALRLSRKISDAACALAAYHAWGERFAEKLNGDFAIAVFDERSRQLVLCRDAIGLRPLYYYRGDRVFVFASEIKALLAHPDVPCRPDDEGVADYMLHTARPLDAQHVTCFSGVSALAPAHLAAVTSERFLTRQYWDFDTGHTIRLRSFDAYVEAFRERFAEAVRRRIRSAYPIAVSLSGGLDSSSIFCQAEELRRHARTPCPRIVGVSYVGDTGTDADERQYLTDIERQYHVELERFPIEPLVGLVDGAEDQIRAIEAPFFDYMWGVTRELHSRATANGARVLLTGTWGDQMLFSCGYLIDMFRRLAWLGVWRHLREYREWIGAPVAREVARRFAVDLVRQHLPRPLIPPIKYFRRLTRPPRPQGCYSPGFLKSALRFADRPAAIGHGFHSVQAKSLYMQARSKYHVHCLEWNNKIGASRSMDTALPFLDRDLVAFLMAIPGEVQNWNGVPRALLREALRGVLPEPIRRRNWKADFSEVVNSGVSHDAAIVAQTLSTNALAVKFGYLDADRLAPEVARLASGLNGPDCVSSWTLADLFGLEVWLEVFFGRAAQTALSPPATAMEAS
jgi:asparagine synthase (glutamine-hydrolysing)